MKKIFNRDFIMKLTFIFLLIQPILDIKVFYDFEIFGVTIPTIIRLIIFAFLFLLFMFNKKKFKLPIFYFILFFIYMLLHLWNASNNYINVSGRYSPLSEVIYLIRLAIPVMFIIFSYNYHFEAKGVSKLFYMIALIFSTIMLLTNILGIAYPSYTQTTEIIGNIFSWPFLDRTQAGYFHLATKGWFGYANTLAGLFCLILPFLLYSFYKKTTLKKFITIFLFLVSMLILGTRISSYMAIIIPIFMLLIYIVLYGLFKKEKMNLKTLVYSLMMILIIIPIFIFSPINFASDRYSLEEENEYVVENNLLDKVEHYRKLVDSGINSVEQKDIERFIRTHAEYFSVHIGLAPYKYLYDDYIPFWLDYFTISYTNQNDTRDFENYLYHHIYQHNHNRYDKFLGFGYSQCFNDEMVLEQDGIYHFYTLGLVGLFLFIIPYFAILIYAIIKVLLDFKNKANLENITYIFSIGVILGLALIGGNLFDFFLVNIFLSFICGQLLYNVKNKNCKVVSDAMNKNIEYNDLISVIVPVYKVEEYLEKCLDSLVNQTYKNIEIIIVNDGSVDNSQQIIDKYQKKYPKLIKSYIKENGGLSSARNFGLKKASGDYIAFVDSDDYVDVTMYEKLYNKAISHNFDLVVCDLNYIYPNNIKSCSCNLNCDIHTKDEVKKIMTIIYPAAWNKLYKKELLKDMTFKKGIWYEDVEFLYRLFPRINSIGVVEENLYQYVQREGAITSTFNDKIYDYIDNWNGVIDYYKKNNLFNEYKMELEYCYVRYLYATMIKGLLKWHDREKYDIGVKRAIDNVNKNFSNYKKNKYIKKFNLKNLYLRYFNRTLANLMFKLKK